MFLGLQVRPIYGTLGLVAVAALGCSTATSRSEGRRPIMDIEITQLWQHTLRLIDQVSKSAD